MKCNECNKIFTEKSNLKRHIKTHIKSSDEQFSCSICKKTFNRSDVLKQHLRTHEEPEFQCTHCKEYFSTKYNLERHLESNHKINFPGMGSIISDEKVEAPKTFKCPRCVKQGMMLHIESYHKKQGNSGIISCGKTMFGTFENENSDFQHSSQNNNNGNNIKNMDNAPFFQSEEEKMELFLYQKKRKWMILLLKII